MAFKDLLADPSQRGLLVTIESESLVPHATLPSTNPSLYDDLDSLQPHVKPDSALYILLRDSSSPTASLIAITYVPQPAPVRQKTLFASTRLSLLRDLGAPHFSSAHFATEPSDLTPAGLRALVAHESAPPPLTREEQDSADLRAAEAAEGGGGGTGARRGHVHGRVEIPLGDGVREALEALRAGEGDLVQLRWYVPSETVLLAGDGCERASAAELPTRLSAEEPRYAFFRHGGRVAFVYTCPAGSRVKDRMLYATGLRGVMSLGEAAGIEVVKRVSLRFVLSRSIRYFCVSVELTVRLVLLQIEYTDPSDITPESLDEELAPKGAAADGGDASALGGERRAFAKPKRPGRR